MQYGQLEDTGAYSISVFSSKTRLTH